jgi:hypothetical protein
MQENDGIERKPAFWSSASAQSLAAQWRGMFFALKLLFSGVAPKVTPLTFGSLLGLSQHCSI